MILTALKAHLRALFYPDLVARAGADLERIQRQYEDAHAGMYARARAAEKRGKALSERAKAQFVAAADNISQAERARRVPERLSEILR